MFSFALLLTMISASPNNDTTILNASSVTASNETSLNKTLMLQLVNDARKKGCQCGTTWYPSTAPLTWNELLEKAALGHSNDMNQKKFFGHASSNGLGAGPRITASSYNWKVYGENIAQGFTNEREVVAGWLKSPGHCANIMSQDYKEMGAAVVNGYWTQDFGTRK